MAPEASQGRPKDRPRPPQTTPIRSGAQNCTRVRRFPKTCRKMHVFVSRFRFFVFFGENRKPECNLGRHAPKGPQGPPVECPRPPRFGQGPKTVLVFAVLQNTYGKKHAFILRFGFSSFSSKNCPPRLTPKGHPRRPRWPPRGAEVATRGPKDLPKASKRHPCRPRKPPRRPQEEPKSPHEGPQTSPKPPRRTQVASLPLLLLLSLLLSLSLSRPKPRRRPRVPSSPNQRSFQSSFQILGSGR